MAGAEFPSAVRAEMRRRTGGRCQFPNCVKPMTQLHHRLMRSQGGKGTLDNAMAVCNAHHDYIHAHPAESYENGWLIRSGVQGVAG